MTTKDNNNLWHVYIIECSDKTLYTGITNNLRRRIQEHNSGNGCRFTKFRRPLKLLHKEKFFSKIEALKREKEIKGLRRDKKLQLIQALPVLD
ncbi:MAG: GIY-YIG nuclease family protein [Candidatus Omnitrophica bacterium]|nr:GIY-YIG nuclease family protein [Candidatus Omnitrophota bacterium]